MEKAINWLAAVATAYGYGIGIYFHPHGQLVTLVIKDGTKRLEDMFRLNSGDDEADVIDRAKAMVERARRGEWDAR